MSNFFPIVFWWFLIGVNSLIVVFSLVSGLRDIFLLSSLTILFCGLTIYLKKVSEKLESINKRGKK